MLPRRFNYFAPTTVEEAAGLLKEHQGDVKILAGGMSLIPLMKMRLASPGNVVDINRVKGLEYIEESADGKTLLIGSLTRHHTLESSALAKRRVPLLSEAAGSIGDSQVRNLGTIGGALAHSDPSGDWGAAILALRGEVTVIGSRGERSIPIDDFLVDTFTTALDEGELITRVSVPIPPGMGSGGAYLKLERKAGDFATAGVAVQIALEKAGDRCAYAGIGLTALGAKNLRASGAEACLLGMRLTKESISKAASAAAEECAPTDDPLRGSAKYKRQMAGVFTRRALELATARARKQGGGAAR
ncbi:MAG TPA: xanthine dehydrogenase family protein subunit M [Nitrososphaerales archaeon]|nr:xanthine dehydrogenase family protein subunit M [Nitrososphaerales archaeon]